MTWKLTAAILRETGKKLSVEEIQSAPLKFGQVLVRVIYSGICRSQLMEQEGKRGEDKWLPHLLGHEGFGEVVEIGSGVSKCKTGDRVILTWIEGSGINAENAIYSDNNGNRINSGKVTTFSTMSIISENRIFLAPSGFPDQFLALFGCALLTGGGMAVKYGPSSDVKKICIVGFGGIGSAAALVLKGMGKSHIDVIETAIEKRIQAHNLGFTNVYPAFNGNFNEYDLVIEATGTTLAIEKGFESLNNTGTLVFASHPEFGSKISLDPHELIKGKKIFGTWGGGVNLDVDVLEIADFLRNSGSDLNYLIGEEFSIDEVNEGLAYLDSGKTGRPLLKLNEV
jgi:S-(hydroxymethyl)glutathione dehydrogenase/alcohol dehydrogenase